MSDQGERISFHVFLMIINTFWKRDSSPINNSSLYNVYMSLHNIHSLRIDWTLHFCHCILPLRFCIFAALAFVLTFCFAFVAFVLLYLRFDFFFLFSF